MSDTGRQWERMCHFGTCSGPFVGIATRMRARGQDTMKSTAVPFSPALLCFTPQSPNSPSIPAAFYLFCESQGPSNVPAATASHHFACLSDLITCVQQGCEDLLTLPLWFYLVIARIFFLSLSLHLSRSFLLCVVVFVRISRSNHKSDQRSKLHVLTLFVKKSSSRRRRRRKRKKERKRRRRMKKLGENIWWNIYRRIKPGLMDETRVFYPASQRVILEIVLR